MEAKPFLKQKDTSQGVQVEKVIYNNLQSRSLPVEVTEKPEGAHKGG